MKANNNTIFLIAGFLGLFTGVLHGQTSDLRPEPPEIISVTVDPETGYTIITWQPSPTPDLVDYYYVGQKQKDVVNTIREISSPLYPPQYSFTITTDEALASSEAYSVKAINDLGGGDDYHSPYDTPHNTIFLQAEFDSCKSSISLKWNDYYNWIGSIEKYEVYRRVEAGVYILQATIDEGTAVELGNLDPNQTYDLFVEAFHRDGVRTSKSNLVKIETQMEEVPDFINADYATRSEGNGIDLSFTVGGTSDLSFYRLLRGNSFEGPYAVVDSFTTTENRILYTDDVDFTSGIYFYKLEVVNNCGLGAIQSNGANNIILQGSISDFNINLEWNEYRDWQGDVAHYEVIRTIGRQNPVTDTIGITGNTTYNDDINDHVNYLDPEEGLICYSVVADENPNIYGITGSSESNQLCFSVNPGVRIPNAFIPNDTEPENQVFEPVFTFLPEHYETLIYNRLGSKIWEGTGPWDGRAGGKYVPEGVYVYFIRVFNWSGEITEFSGRVTVIYR